MNSQQNPPAAVIGDALAGRTTCDLVAEYGRLFPALVSWGLLLAAVVVLPGMVGSYWSFVLAQSAVTATILLSLTLLTGMAGQVSLAQSAFAGAGAYTCARLGLAFHLSLWEALPGAIVVGFLLGVVVGLPALRLSGIYLAISTFGMAVVAERLVFQLPLLGGLGGLALQRPRAPIDLTSNIAFSRFCLAFLAVLLFFLWRLRETRTGWWLTAIRDDERAATVAGVDVPVHKLLAFGYAGSVAAVAGGLGGYLSLHVNPQDFSAFNSIVYLSLLVVVGSDSLIGAVFGGLLYILVPQAATAVDNRLSGVLLLALPMLLMVALSFRRPGPRRSVRARFMSLVQRLQDAPR